MSEVERSRCIDIYQTLPDDKRLELENEFRNRMIEVGILIGMKKENGEVALEEGEELPAYKYQTVADEMMPIHSLSVDQYMGLAFYVGKKDYDELHN